jgi:hypothetical protein
MALEHSVWDAHLSLPERRQAPKHRYDKVFDQLKFIELRSYYLNPESQANEILKY